jgi:release factor glutamine methyltransferase
MTYRHLPPNQSRTLFEALDKAHILLATISDSPRLDAELLLSFVLGCERSFLHAHPEAALTQSQARHYGMFLERRMQGEPLAYIVGVKEFWSLRLRVTPQVLIPRPETELLVELALAEIPEDETFKIADLGTGSGAVALAIASERPNSKVLATDISEPALAIAADSAKRLGLTNIDFLVGDWFAPLRGHFRVIVSNPPYIPSNDPHLHRLQFEPRAALISSADGLNDLALIVHGAGLFLQVGGWLIVEHGFEQGPAVRALFKRHGFDEVRSDLDLAGRERATAGRWPRTSLHQ